MKQPVKRRVPFEWQKLLVGYAVAGFLAFYSVGAIWGYIESTNAPNSVMQMIGVLAGEFGVYAWITWHVKRKWPASRLWCLAAATIMGGALVIHGAAAAKFTSAKREAAGALSTLTEGQAKLIEAGTKGTQDGARQTADSLRKSGAKNSTVNSVLKSGNENAAKITIEGQKILADSTLKAEEQARKSTFLDPEYLNGKMFAVIFCLLLGLMAVTYFVFEMGKAEEDDDNDGIPNFADLASSHYDPARAATWWNARGQDPPHLTAPPKNAQATPQADSLPAASNPQIQEEVQKLVAQMLRDSAKTPPGFAPATASAEPKPTVRWRGGRIVEDERPNGQRR